MTNQKQPQLHPSLAGPLCCALTGSEPNVASVMADSVSAERDCRVAELESEIVALHKSLDYRRTVEGWASADGAKERSFRLTYYCQGHQEPERFDIELWDDGDQVFADFCASPDEAFSAAAEWVRRQS